MASGTTRKMVFGDEWLSSPKPFISSPRLLRDEHGFGWRRYIWSVCYKTVDTSSRFICWQLLIPLHVLLGAPWQTFYLLTIYFVTKRFICWQLLIPLSYTRLMGRSLAYTPNISSSSESSRHTTVDTPKALYDRRERVRNVWASSHVLSRLLKSSAF